MYTENTYIILWGTGIFFCELQDTVYTTLLFCQTFTIPANIFHAGCLLQLEFFREA